MKADRVSPAGLNHSPARCSAGIGRSGVSAIAVRQLNPSPEVALNTATAANTSNMVSWNPTRTNWTFSVVVIPR